MDITSQVCGEDFETIGPNMPLEGFLLYAALSQLAVSFPGTLVLDTYKVYMAIYPRPFFGGPKLLEEVVESISSATGQVLIPVLLDNPGHFAGHFVLAVVNNTTGTVQYYNSADGASPTFIQSMVSTLLPSKDVSYTHAHYQSPQQAPNSVDCGVAVFLSALQLLLDPAVTEIAIEPHAMYWLAGRAAILELCARNAGSADAVVKVSAALAHAIKQVNGDMVILNGLAQSNMTYLISSFAKVQKKGSGGNGKEISQVVARLQGIADL
jgi:hypothetical protein